MSQRAERRYPRLPVEAPAFVADERGTRRARVVDVSLGGASLLVDDPIAERAEIILLVGKSPSLTGGLPEMRGEVRWSQPVKQGLTRIGVAFTSLTREAEARLFGLWFSSTTRATTSS